MTLGQVSVQEFPFRSVNIIPPMLHNDLHLNRILFRRTNGQSLGSCKQENAFSFSDIGQHWAERYSLHVIVTTITEVFPRFFLSWKANARVKPAKMGHGPHSF
jgi:hypothetical protein